MDTIKYNGKVTADGKLKIWNKEQFYDDLKYFAESDIEIIVGKQKKSVSKKQRGYWFAVVVEMVWKQLLQLGYRITKGQTHQFLMNEFFFEEMVNKNTGQIYKIPMSLKEGEGVTTKMFSDKVEEIQQWCSEHIDLFVPSPNEQIKANL